MSHSEGGVRLMSYGWFVKRCTFISTSTKCTCAPIRGTEVSVCGLVVKRAGGFIPNECQVQGGRGPLLRGQDQELRVNWSCSMGFFTQAPSPALWKALMSACLAEWYSEAACLASWYELGFNILLDKMDDS